MLIPCIMFRLACEEGKGVGSYRWWSVELSFLKCCNDLVNYFIPNIFLNYLFIV